MEVGVNSEAEWRELQRQQNRCRNCGELGHYTQECQDFGPWFPAEGKTRADYAELDEEIRLKIAQDIMEEHAPAGEDLQPTPPSDSM